MQSFKCLLRVLSLDNNDLDNELRADLPPQDPQIQQQQQQRQHQQQRQGSDFGRY